MAKLITAVPAAGAPVLDWSSGTITDGQNVTNDNRTFQLQDPPHVITVDVHGSSISLRCNTDGELAVNFREGEFVLQTALPSDTLLVSFQPPVRWAITQVVAFGSAPPLKFRARCSAQLSDGTRTPELSVDGVTTTSRDGSAPRIGLATEATDASINVLAFSVQGIGVSLVVGFGTNQLTYASPDAMGTQPSSKRAKAPTPKKSARKGAGRTS